MAESTVRPKDPKGTGKRTRRRAPGTGSVCQLASGKWRASILVTVDGETTRKYLQADTSAAVVDRLQTAQADADKAAALAASPTLAWWAARWLDTVSLRVRPATLRSYRNMMQTHVLPALGDRPLVSLRAADVETMTARMLRRGLAPNTAALARRVLVACLSDAERDERIPRNVARSARPPRVEDRDRRRLTPVEVRRLLALAAKDPHTDVLVHLAIGTGARVGELCALDWSDIDLAAGTMFVHGSLSRVGLSALRSLAAGGEWSRFPGSRLPPSGASWTADRVRRGPS